MKPATKLEKQHMARISQMPCCICADFPVHVHHITNCGRRLGNLFTLPLCPRCHVGDDGFSGINSSAWDKSLSNQLELMAVLYLQHSIEIPQRVNKIVPRRLDYLK